MNLFDNPSLNEVLETNHGDTTMIWRQSEHVPRVKIKGVTLPKDDFFAWEILCKMYAEKFGVKKYEVHPKVSIYEWFDEIRPRPFVDKRITQSCLHLKKKY